MIRLHEVTKRFDTTAAIENFSLSIAGGELRVLVGPSGCGKSTVLRMINAMIPADRGTIEVQGRNIAAISPVELRRGIGYVIQSVGLFPHWTIADNILAVPRLLGWAQPKCRARLDEIISLVGIDPHLLARYPRHLSGGQQQRIGIARALAADPQIILMDEPFAALDPLSRGNLQDEICRIHKESGKTIVFVSHDMDEALHMATQIAVMRQGRLVQTGTPAEILLDPADDFVQSFVGGADLTYRILDVVPVTARMQKGAAIEALTIAGDASLKAALSLMLAKSCDRLRVDGEDGQPVGSIAIGDILGGGR